MQLTADYLQFLYGTEEAGHGIRFILHEKFERRVSCNESGELRMQGTRKGWEAWRFVKCENSDNFVITSWTHDDRALCSDSEGRVFTADAKELLRGGGLAPGEWKISPQPQSRSVRIKSARHGRFLAFSDHDLYTMDKEEDTHWHLEPALRNLNTCLPCMEAADGELCFISHSRHRRQISCDVFGKLRMHKGWEGWEAWRFTKACDSGNFIITSWTHDDKVLCSNGDGAVYSTSKTKLLQDGNLVLEEWEISLHPKNYGVRIKSVKQGRFLAFSGHDLYTMDKEEDTAWHLEPAHRNHFFISSACRSKRLSSTKDDKLMTHRNRKSWEKWVVEPTNDLIGQFTILSLEHGKYLGSSDDGNLIQTVSESKQCWTIGSSPHGGTFIKSVEHGGWLSLNDNGHPFLSKAYESWETWYLEPIMPITINGKQIWCLVGVGVTTITLTIATPFAVMGIVGAMGFGAEGIAVGSMAAGMMSAEAITSGGGAIAGGTVATLQSIGAAGLGAAGAGAASGAGAVAGGLTSLGAVAFTRGLGNEHDTIELEEPRERLPLCAWRMWNSSH